jgi:hypothetical protein
MELSKLELKPTKSDIKVASKNIMQSIESGKINPLDLALQIKVLDELLKDLRERLMDYSLDEIDKHGGKTSLYDVKIERVEAGIKYSFDHDDTWRLLKADVDSATEKLKARESIMKAVPEGMEMIDKDTGETIPCAYKTSTTTIKISLP